MKIKSLTAALLPCIFVLANCGGDTDDIVEEIEEIITEITEETEETEETLVLDVDTSLFDADSIVAMNEVACTLTNGVETTCYEITVSGFPADRDELGDFCPENIQTTADNAGKWFDGGLLYDLDGSFIAGLDQFYNDSNWQLFDAETGDVFITDTQVACEAAAQPNVEEQYQNHCVQCDLDYFAEEAGGGVTSTYTIPVTPMLLDEMTDGQITNVGVAVNGVNLAGAAPTNAILGAYTIAAFDDCVGHVNPAAGYHYHGANHGDGDCPGIDFQEDGHSGIIGYALDGIAIYGMEDSDGLEPDDLDECRGHSDDTRGYHYHSAGPGENAFIGCFAGAVVADEDDRPAR